MSRAVAIVALVVLLGLCVAAHGPYHRDRDGMHGGREHEGHKHGGHGHGGYGRDRAELGAATAKLSVGMMRPLDDGGLLVETFELAMRGGALASLRNAMALDRVLPGLAALQQTEESEWPQDLQVSYCDSLVSAREQTSCLMELIRRMEEDVNRKMEILIDSDVGQQAQIAGLWIVILLLLLLGTCGMCLKMLRRRHRRNTYKRIQRKLSKLEQIARSPNDEHVVPHTTNTGAEYELSSYNLVPPSFAVPPSPQVLFQPIQVMPQYFPLPSQE